MDTLSIAPLEAEAATLWREFAECKGQTSLFFAKRAERPEARARREARALALCQACAVRRECRQFARSNREYGYWGAESEEERHLAGFTLAAPIGSRIRLINNRRRVDEAAQSDDAGADLLIGRWVT